MGRLTPTHPNHPPSYNQQFQNTPENIPTGYQPFPSDSSPNECQPEPENSPTNYDQSFPPENSPANYDSSFPPANSPADYDSSFPTENSPADYNSPLPPENNTPNQPPYAAQPSTFPQPGPQPATQPGFASQPQYTPGNFPSMQQPNPQPGNRPPHAHIPSSYQPGNSPAASQQCPPHGQGYTPPPVSFPPENFNGGRQQYQPASEQLTAQTTYPSFQSPVQHSVAVHGVPLQHVYQPSPLPAFAHNQAWKTELLGCMEDPELAITTALFPCMTFGQIAEVLDNGHTTCATSGAIYGGLFLLLMPCILSCTYRTKLRNRFGLVEAPAPDWATHLVCQWCALCQEYRELKSRGINPALGLQGLADKYQSQQQQTQVTLTPPTNQMMMG